MALISRIKLNIAERLKKDKGYRERFFLGQAQDYIASRIKSLREIRQMNQTALANAAGMKQSAISRIEQADYSGWSFRTLFRVANALDARLSISFEPSEEVIAYYERREKQLDLEDKVKKISFDRHATGRKPDLDLSLAGFTNRNIEIGIHQERN